METRLDKWVRFSALCRRAPRGSSCGTAPFLLKKPAGTKRIPERSLMLPIAPDPGARHQLSRDERRSFTAAAFRRAAHTHDEAERKRILDQVVLANVAVARTIASRYRSRGISLEDLEQVASAALVRAVHRFDDRLTSDFLAFAVPSIRGEVRRYFRDKGWMVRPPRRVQELQTQVLEARDQLRAETGRPCSNRAIAEALDVPESDVVEALRAEGCFAPSSLDVPLTEGGSTLVGDALADPRGEEHLAAAEARVMLRPLIRRLSDRDRSLLRLRFFEERTQMEIGEELGVTQTQVSRMLTRVLGELRGSLSSSSDRQR